MSNLDLEIVVEDPTAPEVDSPAVADTRSVEIFVSLLLLALAVTLGYDNWRTGIAWDSTGPQAGYFPFYLSVILGGASLYGLATTVLARHAVSRALRRKLLPDRGLHADGRQDRAVEIAAHSIPLHRDHVRHLRHRLRRHHAEGAARSGTRTL